MHTYLIHKTRSLVFNTFYKVIFLLIFSLSCSEQKTKKLPASLAEIFFSPITNDCNTRSKNHCDMPSLDKKSKKIQEKRAPNSCKSKRKVQVNNENDFTEHDSHEETIVFFKTLVDPEKTKKLPASIAENFFPPEKKHEFEYKNEQKCQSLYSTLHSNNHLKQDSCKTKYPKCLCLYLQADSISITNNESEEEANCHVELLAKNNYPPYLANKSLEIYQNDVKQKTTPFSLEYMKLLHTIDALNQKIFSINNNKKNLVSIDNISSLTAMIYMTITSKTYGKLLSEDCFKNVFLKIMQSNNSKIHFYIENIEDFLINISKPNQAEEFVYEINTAILPQTSSYASKLASNQDLLGDEYSNFLLFCSNISKIKILSYGEKYIVIIERKFLKNNSLEKNYFYTTLKLNSNADHFFESPKINFCIVENSSKIYELPEKKDSYEKRKNLFIITKFNNAWAVICYHAPQKYT